MSIRGLAVTDIPTMEEAIEVMEYLEPEYEYGYEDLEDDYEYIRAKQYKRGLTKDPNNVTVFDDGAEYSYYYAWAGYSFIDCFKDCKKIDYKDFRKEYLDAGN